MNTNLRNAAFLAALLGACSEPRQAASQADAQALAALMRAGWDRPGASLEAGPIVVSGDHAVADWTQGDSGGRALLRRQASGWSTVLCAGDGIRGAAGLAAAGVPPAEAKRLAERLAEAERKVPARRLARMSAFVGVVRMEGGDGHAEDR